MYKQKRRTRTDESIREDALEALFESYSVDASAIVVNVSDGVVTLKGFVATEEQIAGAPRFVENLNGVLEVINHLKLRPPRDQSLINPGFETGFS